MKIKKVIAERMKGKPGKRGETTGMNLDKPGVGDIRTKAERKSRFNVDKDKNS